MRVRGGLKLDDSIAHLWVHFDVNHLYFECYIAYSLNYRILDPQEQRIEIRLLPIYWIETQKDFLIISKF